jgi:HAMP domain-containing protein
MEYLDARLWGTLAAIALLIGLTLATFSIGRGRPAGTLERARRRLAAGQPRQAMLQALEALAPFPIEMGRYLLLASLTGGSRRRGGTEALEGWHSGMQRNLDLLAFLREAAARALDGLEEGLSRVDGYFRDHALGPLTEEQRQDWLQLWLPVMQHRGELVRRLRAGG